MKWSSKPRIENPRNTRLVLLVGLLLDDSIGLFVGSNPILFAEPATEIDLAALRRTKWIVRPLNVLTGHVAVADRTLHLFHGQSNYLAGPSDFLGVDGAELVVGAAGALSVDFAGGASAFSDFL